MAHRGPSAALPAGRPAGWCGAFVAVLLLAWGFRETSAQELEAVRAFRTTAQGIAAGRFLLYPSITVDSGYNDNVFYRSEDIPGSDLVSSGELRVSPRLMVDLPLSRSRVRFVYLMQYRDYSSDDYVPSEPMSHFFDLEASLNVGTAITLALRDHYVQGTQEVQQIDPGGELRFGVVPFTLSEPSAELTVSLGARHHLSFLPRLSTLNFDDRVQAGFYDWERRGLTGRYAYQIDPVTVTYASYYAEDTEQNRETVFQGDITVDTRRVGAGLQRSFAGSVVSTVYAGYETQDYEGGAGRDFSGLVYDANLAWAAQDVYRFEATAGRQPYQSFFANSSYYLSDSLKLSVARQIGRSGFCSMGVGLQRNTYADPIDISVPPGSPAGPDLDQDNDGLIDLLEFLEPSQGILREDRVRLFEIGAGFRFSPALRLSLVYNHEARDSNMVYVEIQPNNPGITSGPTFEPFDYTVDRMYLRIEVGFL